MTESQFKQWFEGFTEANDGKVPTAKQWTKIKERISQITGTPIIEKHFYDRYWWPHQPYWSYLSVGSLGSGTCLAGSQAGVTLQSNADNAMSLSNSVVGQMLTEGVNAARANFNCADAITYTPEFDAAAALYALGRADFEELA